VKKKGGKMCTVGGCQRKGSGLAIALVKGRQPARKRVAHLSLASCEWRGKRFGGH